MTDRVFYKLPPVRLQVFVPVFPELRHHLPFVSLLDVGVAFIVMRKMATNANRHKVSFIASQKIGKTFGKMVMGSYCSLPAGITKRPLCNP